MTETAVSDIPVTCFAPAERAADYELSQQHEAVMLEELVEVFMQAMPGYAMLLNRQRQILAVNLAMLTVTGREDCRELIGKRPGEALNCVHSCTAPLGCGTDEQCSVCGAVLAILESQEKDKKAIKECHVTLKGEHDVVIELLAVASPIQIRDEHFTILTLQDISNEKRREILEKVFFHDVINTAGGIHGLATMLAEHENLPEHVESEYKKWLVTMSGNLVEEIHVQRKLLMAEYGEFEPELSQFGIRVLIDEIMQQYQHHEKTPGRNLIIREFSDVVITTDHAVMRRIIGNMTINALEATEIGGTVTIGVEKSDASVSVHVHNDGVMPQEVQLQIFKRSFTTKAVKGRGIGTYSMKLFGERYLKGNVSFKSNQEEGTVFSYTIPLG